MQSVGILNPALDLRLDGPAEQYIGRDSETVRFTVTNTSDAPGAEHRW